MTGPRPAAPRWTEHDEKELLEMLNAGKTAVEISRTPGAIYSRLQRLYRRQRPHSESSTQPPPPCCNGS
jgi:hypothetical protein